MSNSQKVVCQDDKDTFLYTVVLDSENGSKHNISKSIL